MDIVDIVRARLRDGRPIGDAYAADLISRIEALETQLAEQIDYKAAFIEARFQLNAADALADDVAKLATHKKDGDLHHPAHPRLFKSLAAYNEAKKSGAS